MPGPRTRVRISLDDAMRHMAEAEEGAPSWDVWNEADSFPIGTVVKYIGPNLKSGTLFSIYGLKCIGEETGEPIYYVKFYDGDEAGETYHYGVHHKYLKITDIETRIDWEV